MSKTRLAYLVSHPIQYQAPLFRRLAASQVVDFVALFGSNFGQGGGFDPQFGQRVDFGVDLLSGYASIFLPGPAHASIDKTFGLRTPSIYTAWNAARPDVMVLHGWRTAMLWQAALAAMRLRRPFLLRAETPRLRHEAAKIGLRRRLRNVAVRRLVGQASRLLSLGAANERFYAHMGATPQQLVRMPYFVDNAAVRAAAQAGHQQRRALRVAMGIPDGAIVVIAVAKLIARKRPADLLHAMQHLSPAVHLVWVGSGDLAAEVQHITHVLGLGSRVHWLGFKPSPEVWKLFGMADLFALPSMEEPWGLVLNEAVAAGLPVLASDACGAAEDLIVPGRTGDIVPMGSIAAWRQALGLWGARIAQQDRGDAVEMQRLADAHSIERAASALEGAALASHNQARGA